jgi:hypothetical protein
MHLKCVALHSADRTPRRKDYIEHRIDGLFAYSHNMDYSLSPGLHSPYRLSLYAVLPLWGLGLQRLHVTICGVLVILVSPS